MADTAQTVRFTDGEGYEQFMGRWSRIAGRAFLEWLSMPEGLRWLDVGCGTGAFTEVIAESSQPTEIIGIDPSSDQISYAQAHAAAKAAEFRVADARAMPFETGRFDVAVSSLVLNFIPDREKAVAEMRRVVKSSGVVAAYVWDFAGRAGTVQHLNAAIRELEGPDFHPAALYAESTTLESLRNLFQGAGLTNVETRAFDVPVNFQNFGDYWDSNTNFASPTGATVRGYTQEKKVRLMELVKTKLPFNDQKAISFTARVNAARGRA